MALSQDWMATMKPLNYGITKYPELNRLHGLEYRKAWNKLHPDITREAQKRYRNTEKGKLNNSKCHREERHRKVD